MTNQPKQYLPLSKSLRERYADDYIRRYRALRTSRARAIDKQLQVVKTCGMHCVACALQSSKPDCVSI